jgi:hypothetical protein
VGAVRYLTLADGRKLFEGSRLDSGLVLEDIGSRRLTVSRRGRRYHYPVGGRP